MLNASQKYALDGATVAQMPELLEAAAIEAVSPLCDGDSVPVSARIMPDRAAVLVHLRKRDAFTASSDTAGAANTSDQALAAIFDEIVLRESFAICPIGDAFLEAAASSIRDSGFSLPDELSVPPSGIAPDREASPYARSLLNAYVRSGVPWRRSDASRNALLRCLLLYSAADAELESVHSAAVRAVLFALAGSPLGASCSAAMQAALRYAEARSSDTNK
ncbi:MAG: hypothetical protein IKI64_07980 [Clostridia bacterium]|nr:hypothetical protein [Clostridia bacterium]